LLRVGLKWRFSTKLVGWKGSHFSELQNRTTIRTIIGRSGNSFQETQITVIVLIPIISGKLPIPQVRHRLHSEATSLLHLPEVSGQRTKSCATIVAVWATTLPSAIGLPHIPKGRAEVTRTETETEIRAMTVAAVVTAEAAIHRIREKPKEE